MFERILVPLDGSPVAERALPFARRLASPNHGHLIVLRAVPPSRIPMYERTVDRMKSMRDAEEYLESLFPRAAGDHTIETVTYFDEPATSIVTEAEQRRADLIVIATHARAGRGHWAYGSVADQVIRHGQVPVLVIPDSCENCWPVGQGPTVLVALDGSALAEEVLRPATALVQRLGGQLVLARIVHPVYYRPVPGYPDASEVAIDGGDEAEAEGYLAGIATVLRTRGLTVRPEVVANADVVASLLAIADDVHANLLALSTHGRGGIARLLMGSVATGAMERAPLPLLLVRPTSMRPAAAEAQTTAAR
jgi:nucleotide-binding universal stress UspA family protein